jgi:tRNA threonylcarbamoyladenosine biosynthesis protein TsaE
VLHPRRFASWQLKLADAEATAALGTALARAIERRSPAIGDHGMQIGVSGDLGAGKTSLVRGLLRGLGVTGPIKSPTFALLEPYTVSSLDCYHFDFYRFSDPAEFGASGFRELFGPGRLCLIEWPERAGDRLPTSDVSITLKVDGDGRLASLVAGSELGHACLTSAIAEYPAGVGGA